MMTEFGKKDGWVTAINIFLSSLSFASIFPNEYQLQFIIAPVFGVEPKK